MSFFTSKKKKTVSNKEENQNLFRRTKRNNNNISSAKEPGTAMLPERMLNKPLAVIYESESFHASNSALLAASDDGSFCFGKSSRHRSNASSSRMGSSMSSTTSTDSNISYNACFGSRSIDDSNKTSQKSNAPRRNKAGQRRLRRRRRGLFSWICGCNTRAVSDSKEFSCEFDKIPW